MGTRERHIGHAAARSAPVADPRGGRLFAMPRFLVGITHLVYRRRAFVIAGVITALFLLLLAVLPASFASDPKLSNTVPIYNEVSKEVVDGLIHSSSIPLLLAAVAFSIWGVLVYLRCLDYVLRRRLVAVATISALWMIEVILKYKSFTPFYATVLWYLYYVPMTLIPLLYQLCGLRLAGLEQHRAGRRYRTALWIAAILLIGFVLTNDFHQQVFHFDRSSETWSNDYTYGWGYFAVLIWTAFNFVAFFITGFSLCGARSAPHQKPPAMRVGPNGFTKPPPRRTLAIVQAARNPSREGGGGVWPRRPTACRTRSGCASTTSCSRRSIGAKSSTTK